MTVTTDVKTTDDTVTGRFTLKNLPVLTLDEVKKPAFVVAGLADLAIEQVKEAPAAYIAEVKKARSASPRSRPSSAALPAQVKELRGEVETRVAKAGSRPRLYAQLAVRGERLVSQIRRQPATEAAIAEGKEAVKKAEAAATAAKSPPRPARRPSRAPPRRSASTPPAPRAADPPPRPGARGSRLVRGTTGADMGGEPARARRTVPAPPQPAPARAGGVGACRRRDPPGRRVPGGRQAHQARLARASPASASRCACGASACSGCSAACRGRGDRLPGRRPTGRPGATGPYR